MILIVDVKSGRAGEEAKKRQKAPKSLPPKAGDLASLHLVRALEGGKETILAMPPLLVT